MAPRGLLGLSLLHPLRLAADWRLALAALRPAGGELLGGLLARRWLPLLPHRRLALLARSLPTRPLLAPGRLL